MAEVAEPLEAKPEEVTLRVGNASDPLRVAAALAHSVYAEQRVTLRAIGAGAVNQAVKSLAISRGYAAPRGFDLAFVPGFDTVFGSDRELSVVTFQVVVLH